MQLSFESLFSPILFVLLLVAAVNRLFTFLWRKDRTATVAYFFVVFTCFCLLYLASWMGWPVWARDAVRVVLIWSLAWADWYDWREWFAFIQRAETARMEPATPEPVSTLQALGEAQREPGPTAALEATEKPTDDEPPWETKPAIDERDFG